MEESRISRRKGLAVLGAAVGSALVGTSLAPAANAAPSMRPNTPKAQPNTAYAVNIFNDSELDDFQAIIYQEDPSLGKDVARLAWMTKTCHPGTNLTFSWDVEYNFVWSEVGSLTPGTKFSAGQTINADLDENNGVTLYYNVGAYEFSSTYHVDGSQLFIQEDKSVPKPKGPGSGSVGIGMAGFGTFVVATGSGQSVAFTPKPQYWIAFGKFTDSTVMDIKQLTARAQVQFEGDLTNAKAIYDGSDWTISYS